MFEDDEFVNSCQELDNPDTKGWELFTDTNNVQIYRLYNELTGLYSYKIYGGLEGIDPDICAQVYMDIAYRRNWDGYVKELREIQEAELKSGLYWQVKFPFPLSNRDYVYVRECRELNVNGQKIHVVLAKADEFKSIPPVSGIVRVTDYHQSLAITTDRKGGTKAFMCYFDNPGGMIPTWLINWAAKKGVPNFLTDMHKACSGYAEYQSKLKKDNISKPDS